MENILENVEGHANFTKFLYDCENRANYVIKLVKKANSVAIESMIDKVNKSAIKEIPFYNNFLLEFRSIRLMLHRVAKYFKLKKNEFEVNFCFVFY